MMLLDGSQNRKRYGSIQAPERNSVDANDSIGELKARVRHDLATRLGRMVVDSVNSSGSSSSSARARRSGYRDPSARENDASGRLRSLDRVFANQLFAKNRTFPASVQQQQQQQQTGRLTAPNQWLQSVKNSLCQSAGPNLNQRKAAAAAANGSRELKLRCQLSAGGANSNPNDGASKRIRCAKKVDGPRKNKSDSWPFSINKFSVSSLLPVLAFLLLQAANSAAPAAEGAPIGQFGNIQPIWLRNGLINLDAVDDEQQQQPPPLEGGNPSLSFVQAYRDELEKESPRLDQVLFDLRRPEQPEQPDQQQQPGGSLKSGLKERPTWSPFGRDVLGGSSQEAAGPSVDRFWIERRRLDRNRALEPAPWMRAQPMRRAGYAGPAAAAAAASELMMASEAGDTTSAKAAPPEQQAAAAAIPERRLRKSPNEVYGDILRHLIDEAVQGRDFINEIYDELELRSKQSQSSAGGGDAGSQQQQQLLAGQQSGSPILDHRAGLRGDSSAITQDQLNEPDSALIIAGDEVGTTGDGLASAGAALGSAGLDSAATAAAAATHSNLKATAAAYAQDQLLAGEQSPARASFMGDDAKSAPLQQLQSPFNLDEQIGGAPRQAESFAHSLGESGADSLGESQLSQRFAGLNHAEPAFHVLEEIDQVDDDSQPAGSQLDFSSSSSSQQGGGGDVSFNEPNDDDTDDDDNSGRKLMMLTTNPARQMQSKRRSGASTASAAAAKLASALELSQGQLQLSGAKPNLVDLVGGLLTQNPRAAAGDYGNPPTTTTTTTTTKAWLPSSAAAAATAAAQMMLMRKNSENKIALHMIESGYLDRQQLVQVATKLKSHLEQLVGLSEGSILGLYPINPQQLLIKLDTNRLNALQIVDMIENYDFARGFIVLSWPRGSQKNPLPILVAILNELSRDSMPKAGGNPNLVLDDELTGGGGAIIDRSAAAAAGPLNDANDDDDDDNSQQLAALEPFSSLDAVAQSTRDDLDSDDQNDDRNDDNPQAGRAGERQAIAPSRPQSLEIDVLQPGAIAMPPGKSHISLATLGAILVALNANRLPAGDLSVMPAIAAINDREHDDSSSSGGGGGDDSAAPTSQALIKDATQLHLLDGSHLFQLSALMLAMLGAFLVVKLIMKGNDRRLLRRHFSRSSRSLRSFWSSSSSRDDDNAPGGGGEQTTAGQVSGLADKCSKLGAANLDTKRHLAAETDSIVTGSLDSSDGDRKSLEQLARKLVNVLSGFSIAKHQMPDSDEVGALEQKINPDIESGKSSKTDSGIEAEKLDETRAPYRSSRSYIKALIDVLSKARPFSSGAACEQDDQEARGLVAADGSGDGGGGGSENSSEKSNEQQQQDEQGVLLSQMDITAAHLILAYMETHLDDKERLRREWLQLNASAGLNSSATGGGGSSSNAAKMNERALHRLAKVALSEENRHKNRHPSLVPFDRNRVKLNSPTGAAWGQQPQQQQQQQQQPGKLRQRAPASSGDYINASYIYADDPSRPTHIIAQGPTEQTTGHFWQMIWEQGISVIVMLTRLNENSVRQCHCYWPTNSSGARAAAATDGGGQQTGPSGNVSAQSALQSHSLDDAAAAVAASATNGNARLQQQQQQSAAHSNETTSAARRGSVTSVFNMAAACRPNGQKGQPIIANKELLSNVISFDVCSINSASAGSGCEQAAAAAAGFATATATAASNQAEEKPLSNHEQLTALKSKDQKKRVVAANSSTDQQSHSTTKTIRFEVHLVSEHVSSNDYLVRNMCLVNRSTGETRTVTQFHYLAWPEGGVPENVKNFLQFRRKVHKSYRNLRSPILVHCSNGAGRSGTYTLIDIILERIRNGAKEIDPLATLEHLRSQRVGLCANQSQFEFVLMALAEEIQIILDALPQ